MNRKIFRSADFWKSAIMTMPENSFFELTRSVFGKIKTPFKKQQMISDLESFLLREDIQKTISGYIDENDTKIIAAVALFREPVQEELKSFFSGDISYAQLQDIIVNLEERFIIYRFSEENKNRLALNPVLEQILLPLTADFSLLFPAVPVTAVSAAPPQDNKTIAVSQTVILNDLVLAGLFSFVSEWESFYRGEGVIRKLAADAGKKIFPGINLEFVLGSLQLLGLFYAEGDNLIPDAVRFNDFGTLSARERMEYCAAALLAYTELKSPASPPVPGYMRTSGISGQTGFLPPLYRSRVKEFTGFIHSFIDSLDANLLYTEKTLLRLAEVFKSRTGITVSGSLFDILEKTGLIITIQDQFKQPGAVLQEKAENANKTLITIDSGFSVLVHPEISYSDLINLAAFLSIREAGAVARFELDRDSAVRAFDRGVKADDVLDILKKLSDNRVDDTFSWNLKDWEKRHSEVSLKKGIVLTLSEDRRYLTGTMPLSLLIKDILAPGVYLLPESAMDEAASALQKAGIDIIACSKGEKKTAGVRQYFSRISSDDIRLFEIPSSQASSPQKKGDSRLSMRFHEILEKIQLDKNIKEELSARINRKLILCETQLKDADVRYEKLEAKLLDYAGKQNIAKQAITQQSPLELELQQDKRIFGIPKSLEKENNELILVILPDEQEALRIPLAKIKLLRRIKKSIFS